jgi:hypothetical protein
MNWTVTRRAHAGRLVLPALLVLVLAVVAVAALAVAPPAAHAAAGGEANLKIPPLDQVQVGGMNGRTLLMLGLGVCVLGLVFGLVIYGQLKNLPVHASMREISELIYETCKTYLITQGKFILVLEVFIGAIIILYFGFLLHFEAFRVVIILLSASSASPAATGWPGSVSASTPSPTPGPPSPASRVTPSRSTPSRSRPGCRSACC